MKVGTYIVSLLIAATCFAQDEFYQMMMMPRPAAGLTWDICVVAATNTAHFAITVTNATSFNVAWGDGSVSNYTGNGLTMTHQYDTAGTYTSSLSGAAEGIKFYTQTAPQNILTPIRGITGLKTAYQMFYGNSSILNFPSDLFDNCPSMTNLQQAFISCSSATNACVVTNFVEATSLLQTWRSYELVRVIPEVNALTNITTLNNAWYDCEWTNFPAVDKLTKNTSLLGAWYSTAAKSYPDVSTHTNVTSCYQAWSSCSYMTNVPLVMLPNANLANVGIAFYGCNRMAGAAPAFWDTNIWQNTNLLTYARHSNTFYNCTNLANYTDIPDDWKGL